MMTLMPFDVFTLITNQQRGGSGSAFNDKRGRIQSEQIINPYKLSCNSYWQKLKLSTNVTIIDIDFYI